MQALPQLAGFIVGRISSVDSLVLSLHEQHIHPLFWEAPGLLAYKMYEEAIRNNYLLTRWKTSEYCLWLSVTSGRHGGFHES